MTKFISRRLFLGSAVGSVAASIAAGTWARPTEKSLRPVARPGGLRKKAVKGPDALVGQVGLSGRVSYQVTDVKTGLVLESRGAVNGMPPASVTKAITALYALDALGGDHRFETRIFATSTPVNGVLQGDLILAGGGDPTLDTDALASLVTQLKSAGLREIRGRFLVWGGGLPFTKSIDPDQPDHVGYNPAVSGIALNYNRVHFEWKRGANGYAVAMDARSERLRPSVSMARMKIVARETPVYTYAQKANVDHWTVARGALGKGGSRWLPVRLPALYAGDVLRSLARAQGIPLPKPQDAKTAPKGQVVARHQSARLRVILKAMLRYSTNLTAEMVGLAATKARTGNVRSLRASATEMSRWAQSRMGMPNVRLVDHSGLGDASRVSASAMSMALVKVHQQGLLKPILKPIALRHENGKINKAHPIKVVAKTGTLNFVSALAGYMTAPDGTELAFAIFSADETRRKQVKRGDRERPAGAAGWNKRAKKLQQKLVERWGVLYGT